MLEAKSIKRCAQVAYLFFCACTLCLGQTTTQVQRILFYNCENCFDPADNPERNDDEYTPEGARHWTGFRQYQKLLNIANVIVAAGEGKAPALIGLAEVENDSVLVRLTRGTALRDWDYSYLITQSQDQRGINVALLYQPTDFRLLGWTGVQIPLPAGARPTRDLLHAWGRVVGGDTLDVIVCHLPSRLGGTRQSTPNRRAAHLAIRHLCDSLELLRQHPHVLVMGDMNDVPTTRQLRRDMNFGHGLCNLMDSLQRDLQLGRRAFGSHKYQGEWGFLDQFWTNMVNEECSSNEELGIRNEELNANEELEVRNEELNANANEECSSNEELGVRNEELNANANEDSLGFEVFGSKVLRVKDVGKVKMHIENVDVVHFPFMLVEDETHMGHRPLRSYYGYKYEGGFSDHLPIRLDLVIEY